MPVVTNPDGTPYFQVFWTGGAPGQGQPYYNHGVERGSGPVQGRTFISPSEAAGAANPTSAGYDPALAAWAKGQGAATDYTNPNAPKPTSSGQPDGSTFTTRGTWNPGSGQWDQSVNWSNILNMVIGGFLTAGAADVMMGAPAGTAQAAIDSGTTGEGSAAAGGAVAAPAAAGGVLPSTTIGTGMVAPIAGGTGADLSVLPSTTIGTGAMGPIAGGGGAGSTINQALNQNGNASTLMKTIAALGGLTGGAIGGHFGSANAVPQSLTDMLDLMNKRAQAQNPMFNAVNSGLYQMLPSFAKTGGPPTAV